MAGCGATSVEATVRRSALCGSTTQPRTRAKKLTNDATIKAKSMSKQ